MLTLQNILQVLRQHKAELQRKYPLSAFGVFGSYARREATANSDIDIAVEIDGPMGLSFVAMADEIELLVEIKTDIVSKRAIKFRYLSFRGKRYDICLTESLSLLIERHPSFEGLVPMKRI